VITPKSILFLQFKKYYEHRPTFIYPFGKLSLSKLSIKWTLLGDLRLDDAIVNSRGEILGHNSINYAKLTLII